ncbi:MAG TPA: DUF6345 domain-containing protein [Acidimicrobiia bacterium]
MPTRLPVFRVAMGRADPERLVDLGRGLFGLADFKLDRRQPWSILRSGSKVIEICEDSAGLFAADEARLWNPHLTPELPGEGEAREIAEAFVGKNGLLPMAEKESPFRFAVDSGGGTRLAIEEEGAKRLERQLDMHVTYSTRLVIDDVDERMELPVVGGGGELQVMIGDRGEVIGCCGVLRMPADAGFMVDAISQEEADRRFEELMGNVQLDVYRSSLAYYAAPAFAAQEFMYPVYVYSATAVIDDVAVPLRMVTIPATRFGPELPKATLQVPLRAARSGLQESLQALSLKRSYATLAINPFEAGASWIGLSGGLAGSQQNAQGFIDELAADGWDINFNWGDGNAWESDWRRNDDTWVDAADFVFYTGHANMNGWTLASPDDTFLHFSETGAVPQAPGDLWGQQDLEWAVIAACGPLQDEIIGKGGGNVLTRWGGAFDGLHTLMGYGGITFDNTQEGRRLIQYAKGGQTLIGAWFRAATEIQPSTNGAAAPDGPDIWVGAMWVARSGTTSPSGDHLWGHGSVAPDPTSPNIKACMWTRT